jgi:predicted dienelactone hydrolase
MTRYLRWLLLLAALLCHPALAGEVGFTTVQVPDPPGEDLSVGVWYPTEEAGTPHRLDLFTQTVARDAAIAGGGHPLVVMSHGTGGSYAGHYDTALELARAGFVVAAMTHTGDNYRDQSRVTRLSDRPRAVHAVIGYMLAGWDGHAAIDAGRVGVFGFSLGGFTALVTSGGIPDLGAITPYCAGHPQTYVCEVVRSHGVAAVEPGAVEPGAVEPGSAPVWVADARVRAAVVAAPALGFSFAPAGLARVTIPVQLWQAGDDRILPAPDYAEPVRAALPNPPDFHLVAGAGHFDFLAPCSAALAGAVPAICEEHGGFDRAAFHRDFNAAVVRFFRKTLGG